MQITLGRLLVSVTLFAGALGLGRLAMSSYDVVPLLFFSCLFAFAGIGTLFGRLREFMVLGVITFALLAIASVMLNPPHS